MLRATGYNKSAVSAQTSPHPRYHFHGYAGDQITGDSKFFDRSPLGNHAVRGANLSEAQMLANAGYVSTVDPAGGATDSVLRIPNLNFDYAGGEKLIVYWLGKATPEGAHVRMFGDGYGTSFPGVAVMVATTGATQIVMSDAGAQTFGSMTAEIPFDGTLHSLGFVIDGAARKTGIWIDETMAAHQGGVYTTFGSGISIDTRNARTINLGSSLPADAVSTIGIATQTRAIHILRLSKTDTVPAAATVSALFGQLRANPSKPILGSAF